MTFINIFEQSAMWSVFQKQNKVTCTTLSINSTNVDDITGDHPVKFNITDQIFCTSQTLEKNVNTMQQYISYLQTSRVSIEILHNILIDFGLTRELDRLIMTCLNEPCSEQVSICQMHFLPKMVWRKGMFYCHCFSTREMSKKTSWVWTECDIPAPALQLYCEFTGKNIHITETQIFYSSLARRVLQR